MSALTIIGWGILFITWTSMYFQNSASKKAKTASDYAKSKSWAAVNIAMSFVALVLFVSDFFI